MDNGYVSLKSYNDKIVRVPVNKKDEYLKNQARIKKYLEDGKSIREIIKILGEENDN